MTLADVIAPLSTSAFKERHLGREYGVFTGRPSRFRDLAPWQTLNDVLNSLRILGSRVRLMQNGRPVDRQMYLEDAPDGSGARLKSRETTMLLREGATLIFSHVDELFPNLRTLAESLEEDFRISVGANLYAAWGAEKGFDLHWDDHDTLILQVAGRKKWEVYAPTRLAPIRHDVTGTARQPTDPPAWSGTLEEGDVLYIPRGWWHLACPVHEPTLHVTIGLAHPRGVDLLHWIAEQLQAHVEVRSDLPHLESADAQAAYVETLRHRLIESMTDDVVKQFMQATDRKAKPRPCFHLPESVVSQDFSINPNTLIRLVTGRRLHCTDQNGAANLTFEAAAKAWTCDARFAPALQMLRHNRPCAFETLSRSVPPGLQQSLRLFIEMLFKNGVVALGS